MEGLRCLKFPLEQDDLLCKIDLKEAYFSVPLNKNSQKFVWFQWSCNLDEFLCLCFGLLISMVMQPWRISLTMFWTRASSKNFYKINKSPNCLLETGQHSNHYLSRRYVATGEDVTRNSHCKRHNDFSIATFGFCDQPQKTGHAPCETKSFWAL